MRGFMIFSLLFGNATTASRTAQEKGEILEVLLRMSALKEWRIRSQSEKVGLTRESAPSDMPAQLSPQKRKAKKSD
jgi:hypothetical protein